MDTEGLGLRGLYRLSTVRMTWGEGCTIGVYTHGGEIGKTREERVPRIEQKQAGERRGRSRAGEKYREAEEAPLGAAGGATQGALGNPAGGACNQSQTLGRMRRKEQNGPVSIGALDCKQSKPVRANLNEKKGIQKDSRGSQQ